MLNGKGAVRSDGGLDEEARHKVINKLEFSCLANLFGFRRAGFMWNGKMDPLIISEHSGTTFFMLADILIWEEIMKAIRSSPRLSHWAHNPFVTCLPSALRTSTFLFGFLSALSLCHHHHDTTAYKLCERSNEPQLCMCLLLVIKWCLNGTSAYSPIH